MLKNIISTLVIAGLLTMTAVAPYAFGQDSVEQYNAGFAAGKDHGQNDATLMKIVWGALFGPLAVGYNLFITPSIPDDRILLISGEGEDFTTGYLDGYKQGYKQQAVMYNVIGWASWLLYVVITQAVNN